MLIKHLFVSLAVCCISLLVSCAPADKPEQAKKGILAQPNILFILVDDMGWGDIGYNGSEIKTPNLDTLANSGLKLERAYAYPICSPTRAALLTGQNPLEFGIDGPMENDAQLQAGVTLLPEYLKSAGYNTFMVGKWHLGMGDVKAMPHSRGFDYFYGQLGGFLDYYTHVYFGGLDWQRNGTSVREDGYATHLQTDTAVKLIESYDSAAPFFMYLSYNSPHIPLQYPPNAPYDYAEITNPDRQVYAQMVTDLDGEVRRVVDTISRKGIAENTLIVFMSDNGGNVHVGASNGELRGSKGDAYEGGVRVPSFVIWPLKIKPSQKSDTPVYVQDWLPTLLQAAGADIPGNLEGQNVMSVLEGSGKSLNRAPVILGTGRSKAVYDWPMKLVRITGDTNPDQLYNVVEDPLEAKNLSSEHPDLMVRLGSHLDQLPKKPSKGARGPKPETLFRDADGNFVYDIRKPETREPWAESAKGAKSASGTETPQ